MGDSPSFSWRSILNSREVLKAGVQWRIGDGSQIRIWHDNWIPHCPQYLVQKPANCPLTHVSELIDPSTRSWDVPILATLFTHEVAAKILCIPLSHRVMQETISWKQEKHGFYSVRSAYWIARASVLDHILASSSSGDPYSELWKKLWKAKVPGKVHICLWRACHNLLPTRAKLVSKGYTGAVTCILCAHRLEDNAHIFCQCPTAVSILSSPPFNLKSTLLPNINFKEWMLEQAIHLNSDIFAKLMMVIWSMWKNRNNKLWNDSCQTANDLVLSSLSWLEEYRKARHIVCKPRTRGSQRWKSAEEGHWKLNVDGSFLPNRTAGGIGAVLRDSCGRFLAALATPVIHMASAKQVELVAIQHGLQLLQQLRTEQVVIETDCLQATLDIQNANHERLLEGGLIDDIKMLMQTMPTVTICYAPRTCNAVAHRLANIAYEASSHSLWLDDAPECILDVLNFDCNPPH